MKKIIKKLLLLSSLFFPIIASKKDAITTKQELIKNIQEAESAVHKAREERQTLFLKNMLLFIKQLTTSQITYYSQKLDSDDKSVMAEMIDDMQEWKGKVKPIFCVLESEEHYRRQVRRLQQRFPKESSTFSEYPDWFYEFCPSQYSPYDMAKEVGLKPGTPQYDFFIYLFEEHKK